MTYVKLFFDLLDALEPFGDAERGRLLTAILEYGRTGVVPQLSGNERFIFPMIRAQMDRDSAEYDAKALKTSEARQEAGRKGGKQTQANQAKPSKTKQTQANQAKDKDKDKDKDKEDIPPLPPTGERIFASDAVQSAFDDWLAYKKERREAYKPTGLQAFTSKIHNLITEKGERAVVDAIRNSMANNWAGIHFTNDGGNKALSKAERASRNVDALFDTDDDLFGDIFTEGVVIDD